MDLVNRNGYNLRNLQRQNIVLGKNGCGKSFMLKRVEEALTRDGGIGAVRYVSPERAGALQYDANVDQNMTGAPTWLADTRRQNQAQQFRQQSAAQFRRLELLELRELEKNKTLRLDMSKTFDTVVARINTLLDRVYLERGDPAFVIKDRQTKDNIASGDLSSGESELISLGIEALVFRRECVPERTNVLLLDEPDVHLHPDLQARFGRFLHDLVVSAPITLVVATHSTAFLGAASMDSGTRVAFMRYGDTELIFSPIDDIHRRILPVFGAHPLSNVFNEAPVLLLEGDDDERIWQQAVRSSKGDVRVYPVAVDSVNNLSDFEREVATILESVYDQAIGYSLRDRDEGPTEITDVGPVRRFRLNARAAENLIVSDDALIRAGVTWEELRERVETRLAGNPTHPHFQAIRLFAEGGYDRRNADLKEIRNDLVGLIGSNKPWEVLVGQAIASVANGQTRKGAESLQDYLGEAVCLGLLGYVVALCGCCLTKAE